MRSLLFCFSFLCSLGLEAQQHHAFKFQPELYECLPATHAITIDGQLDDAEWSHAPWTTYFVDIEGDIRPRPFYQTRVKMLWDKNYFYFAAELEEPHLWATYDQHDMVIFHENDFEVFIDPDGDTHNYYEYEINALGTDWDLFLTKPYRDGGKAIDSWEIPNLLSAVKCYGTLNDPSDTDEKWTVELAFPWQVLEEAAAHPGPPQAGETWRVNFSRVQWRIEAKAGKYQKVINPKTGKSYPEYNWVWSPQGAIAMHQPETWGYVVFSSNAETKPVKRPSDEQIRWQLWQLYYAQVAYFKKHQSYTNDLAKLGLTNSEIELTATAQTFEARFPFENKMYIIREDGRILR